MTLKLIASFGALIICAMAASAGNLSAAQLSFQPRVETGVMAYSFRSEEVSHSVLSRMNPLHTGNNFTQESFEYKDNLSFIDAGGTLFFRRLFCDISYKYAFGGNDTETVAWSGFTDFDNYDRETGLPWTSYLASEPHYQVKFDRTETAVSLGYNIGRGCHLFGGYKWARTEFNAVYDGPYGMVVNAGENDQQKGTGRIWGQTDFTFKYEGPFIGVVQGWNFRQRRFMKGTLTTSLALAYLQGEVESKNRTAFFQIKTMNGSEVDSEPSRASSGGITNRFGTKGDSVGLTLSIGWLGLTPLEGLSYHIGITGYRYEFEAEDNFQPDINETSVVYKVGATYLF